MTLATKLLLLTSLIAFTSGCTDVRVRVLDDLSGQPVPGARVVPLVDDLFGTPDRSGLEVADKQGEARIFRVGELHGIEVFHPGMAEVSPHDRAYRDGDVRLKYLRRRPKVVIEVPSGFRGPVTFVGTQQEDEREPMYKVRVMDDGLSPVLLPATSTGLASNDDVDVAFAGGPPTQDGMPVKMWRWHFAFYESQFVEVRFVGTAEAFRKFASILPNREPIRLTRGELAAAGREALAQ